MKREKPATDREVRSFGAFALVALSVAAWLGRRRGLGTEACVALVAFGAALACVALARPALVRPVRRAWMGLGHAMGRVTTPVLLTVFYVAVFVPLHALVVLAGADPLDAKRRPGAATHWRERAKPGFDRDDFERLG